MDRHKVHAPLSCLERLLTHHVSHVQKDKACLPFSGDASPYVPGTITKTLKVKDIAPNAHFAPQVFIRCADQSTTITPAATEWCHIVNRKTNKLKLTEEDKMAQQYWQTKVINSRPKNLYAAVFICCAIGPILLVAFLIYERGVLAKKAQTA
jgi:hypothetical protein